MSTDTTLCVRYSMDEQYLLFISELAWLGILRALKTLQQIVRQYLLSSYPL